MNQRILDRYLLREVLSAWAAVTFILLAIMIATRFASVLGVAAKGELPRELLMNVALLSSLRYLVILIPVSLLLGIMLSLAGLFVPIPFMALDVLVGIIQAYIFSMLALVFIGAAIGDEPKQLPKENT